MIKKYTQIFLLTFFLLAFNLLLFVSPVSGDGEVNTNSGTVNVGGTNSGGSGGGVVVTDTLENPLKGINSIPEFIKSVLDIVLIVGTPIIALAIIYSGFLFVTAQGNPEKLTKAKDAFVYTLIGAAVLLGAYALAQAISGTVDQLVAFV